MMLLSSKSCFIVPCDCWENGAHGVGKIPTHRMCVTVVLQDSSTVLHETASEEQIGEVYIQNIDDEV